MRFQAPLSSETPFFCHGFFSFGREIHFLRAFRLGLSENSSKNEKSRGHKRAYRCRVAPVFTANAKMVPNPLPPLRGGQMLCFLFISSSSYRYLLFFLFFLFLFFLFFSFSSYLSLLFFLFFSSSSLSTRRREGREARAGEGVAGGITLITRTPILGYGE